MKKLIELLKMGRPEAGGLTINHEFSRLSRGMVLGLALRMLVGDSLSVTCGQTPPPDRPGGPPAGNRPSGPGGGPGGNRPAGGPGGGSGGQRPPGGGQRQAYTLSGVLTVDGTTVTNANQSIVSTNLDVSGVYVCNGGLLTLDNATVTTSGQTSNEENSSFFGLNAGVLAAKGGQISLNGGTVKTTGRGANGLFATGAGSRVTMTGGTIEATGDAGHGVMASAGGSLTLTNVTITTARTRAAAVATDRGGGTIHVLGGTYTTHGTTSPGIYSTGRILAWDAKFEATASEAVVIEGQNSVTLTNCTLSGLAKCGAMIYQSFSGDAEGRRGVFTMKGGVLKAAAGPLFYVANSTGVIELNGVDATAASGVIVNASAGRWGRTGENGGHAQLTADAQTLAGDLTCDAISSVAATLKNGSTLTGAIQNGALTLDDSSTWIVTKDSMLTTLTDAKGITDGVLANIRGDGHDVRYNAALPANQWLGGKTYNLANGGRLLPK